jgi:putative tryptophan/tyrosine transport system substrate-binding protein
MTEDMVAAGFAASLARPGGNITGISLMSPELDGKRQDILIEAVPGAHRIAVLADSNVATLEHLRVLETSARSSHGKELVVVRAASANEVSSAMNDASTQGAAARGLQRCVSFVLGSYTVSTAAKFWFGGAGQ